MRLKVLSTQSYVPWSCFLEVIAIGMSVVEDAVAASDLVSWVRISQRYICQGIKLRAWGERVILKLAKAERLKVLVSHPICKPWRYLVADRDFIF